MTRDENVTDLIAALKRSRMQVYAVINGERQSAPLRRRIAEYLGVGVDDIWPPKIEGESLPDSLSGPGGEVIKNAGQGGGR